MNWMLQHFSVWMDIGYEKKQVSDPLHNYQYAKLVFAYQHPTWMENIVPPFLKITCFARSETLRLNKIPPVKKLAQKSQILIFLVYLRRLPLDRPQGSNNLKYPQNLLYNILF